MRWTHRRDRQYRTPPTEAVRQVGLYAAGYRDGTRDAADHDPNGDTDEVRRPGWAERLAKITRQHGRTVPTATDPAPTLVQRDSDLAPGEIRHYSRAGRCGRRTGRPGSGRRASGADEHHR